MTMIAINLPADLYQRLHAEAQRRGTTVEAAAASLLAAELQPVQDEKQHVTAALRAAGLLSELSSEEKQRASRSSLTLDEARAILSRPGGKSLSELVLEMRGPKE